MQSNLKDSLKHNQLQIEVIFIKDLLSLPTDMQYNTANKIIPIAEIAQKAAAWKKSGKTLAFTNGCFDILHAGHVHYLQTAAEKADILILGLNSDKSVKMLKGPSRPVVNETDRAFVMSALTAIGCVVIFDEETPANLINSVIPDILIKGGDYVPEDIVGYDTVVQNGGVVEVVPFVTGKSTTNIVNSIMEQK